ncbi:thiol peroxidase [Sediminibacillus halophilus]|uniref:Thiol peroxidase n=1 Tax=Sediminibacillus halophilus TaxID=482461 RepID=A0A1G9Y822_9BACI|nr:thiol peroxidase [Sediminibacillus halophilus]SDN04671.1 thiol peroxidase, atypical 2-Cys peroxiredoxin [Sediminibacillus halophilus]
MANVTFKGTPMTLIGDEVKVGDAAPDFKVLDNDLNEVRLSDYSGQVRLISVVPSVDTGVCAEQTQRFNDAAEKLSNVKVLTVSMDLPFAQKRWIQANDIQHIDIFSDHKDADFAQQYGVLMEELRLLARSVFVIDSEGKVTYTEYVSEGTNHPDYEKALAAVKETK